MKLHKEQIAAACLVLSACGGGGGADRSAAAACAALAGQTVAGASVLAAVNVAASGPVPVYCRVSARIAPALNFEMRIPDAWNGKLHYGGGGGFNGFIQQVYDAAGGGGTDLDNHGLNLAALKKGYINLSSDSGHAGQIPGLEVVDASWVPGNPAAEQLYADAAIPAVMSSAVEMIRKAYRQAPSKSYFEGCSNGGREALVNAQRFPDLFDGIIARAPANNFTASVGSFQRNMQQVVLDPSLNFTPAKIALLSNAVLAACDGLDGVNDGLVSRPAACGFDAAAARASLRCAGGGDTGDTCLSDAQLALVDTWTSAHTFAGRYTTPGWALTGNESAAGNWDAWLFGGFQFLFQYGAISGFILKDPATGPLPPQDASAVNTLFFDFEDPVNAPAITSFANRIDATDADLRRYMNSGGKLLLWHGGSDAALSVRNSIDYVQRAVTLAGGSTVSDTFLRFYVAPGVNHCHGGAGADKSDLLDALDTWVSGGTAPGDLLATRQAADGSTQFTRPLCRYPTYPRYVGPAGDAAAARLAANYRCVAS